MNSETHKQLVTEFFARLSSASDPLTALELMTESCTWWTSGSFPLSGTRGKDEMAGVFGGMVAILNGPFLLEPKSFTIEGDRVAVEAESHAELKDGRVYNNKYHFLMEVHDGKINAVREYFDTMHTNDIFCS